MIAFPVVRPTDFGPSNLTHSIAVSSGPGGRVAGFFQISGFFGFAVPLASLGGTPSTGVFLHHGCLDGLWQYGVIPAVDLPACGVVDTREQSRASFDVAIKGVLDRVYVKLHEEARREQVMASFTAAGLKEGEQPSVDQISKLADELAERFVAHAERRNHVGTLPGQGLVDELRTMLKNGDEKPT